MDNPKTLSFAVYPNGKRYLIQFKRGHYWYTPNDGSNTMAGAKEQIEYLGGKIERQPNPHYRPAKGLFGNFGK